MSSSLIRLKFRPSVTQLLFQPLSPFLPRDVIHSEDYTRLSVRPSVRLSVRHTVVSYRHSYRQTNIIKLFSSSRRHIILVFFHTKRRRAHAKGGVDCKGDEKITIFGKYIALSMIQDSAIVTIEIGGGGKFCGRFPSPALVNFDPESFFW